MPKSINCKVDAAKIKSTLLIKKNKSPKKNIDSDGSFQSIKKTYPVLDNSNSAIKQVSPYKIMNFPITDLLERMKENVEYITIRKKGNYWYITSSDTKSSNSIVKVDININDNNKTFNFVISKENDIIYVKLSGDRENNHSLNSLVIYVLDQLNNFENKNISQRCRTINRKIIDKFNINVSKVPIDFLIETYDNYINSYEIGDEKNKKWEIFFVNSNASKEIFITPSKYDSNVFKSSIPDTFFLAPSKSIENEYGLFTKIKIDADTKLGEYKGVRYFKDEFSKQRKKKDKKHYENTKYDDLFHYLKKLEKQINPVSYFIRNDNYNFEIGDREIIDCSIQNKSNFIRYSNSGFPNYFANNCEYFTENNKVYLKSIRAIYPGEEILCTYGTNSENNIFNTNIDIKITKIPDDPEKENGKVEFISTENKNEKKQTMKLDDFIKRYYEIFDLYLSQNNKISTYKKYLKQLETKTLLMLGKKKYDRSEFEKYNNSEFDLFKNRLQDKINKIEQKKNKGIKISELLQKHLDLTKTYVNNL